MKLNLKEFRKKNNMTQTDFAKRLIMSLRHYQRCEEANYLPPQAEKIFVLTVKMEKIHGILFKNKDVLKVKLGNAEYQRILNELAVEFAGE